VCHRSGTDSRESLSLDVRRVLVGPAGQLEFELEFGLPDTLEIDLEFDRFAERKGELPLLPDDGELRPVPELLADRDQELAGLGCVEAVLLLEIASGPDSRPSVGIGVVRHRLEYGAYGQNGYSDPVATHQRGFAGPTPREDMALRFDGGVVRGGSAARERFYDSRGYGRPRDGGLVLAPVEAAHLLFRGDLDTVADGETGERLDFQAFLASTAVSEVEFFVYKELRDRGFYLSPAREDGSTRDFVVYPRGQGPWDDAVAYRVRAVGERTDVSVDALRALARDGSATGVLAVVDEESEVTYLAVGEPTITGGTHHDLSAFGGALLADRVVVADPPPALHGRAFYGQRLDGEDGPVQLSLVEAASLAGRGLLSVEGGSGAIAERGRAVEGERFDRRLRVYDALRTAGVVPKTGFKFGADFRTYADVESVDDLGHSELLVRVLPADHAFQPRDLALDVRLAHGVRKRMVFALTGADVAWLSVERLTP